MMIWGGVAPGPVPRTLWATSAPNKLRPSLDVPVVRSHTDDEEHEPVSKP